MLNKISSLQDIRIIIEPTIIAEMIGLAIAVGLGGGFFLRFTVRKKFYSGAPWDRFGNDYLSKYVFLYTIDGKMYRGWIESQEEKMKRKKFV